MKAVRLAMLVLALTSGGSASTATADLGAPLIDRSAGALRIVGFASPLPLRAGASEWTLVVIDRATGQPVRDAEVHMHFARPSDDPHAAHGHSAHVSRAAIETEGARARVELDSTGVWQWHVSISRRGTSRAAEDEAGEIQISESFDVQPRLGFWRTHGAALIAPYLALGVFAIQQALTKRRSP